VTSYIHVFASRRSLDVPPTSYFGSFLSLEECSRHSSSGGAQKRGEHWRLAEVGGSGGGGRFSPDSIVTASGKSGGGGGRRLRRRSLFPTEWVASGVCASLMRHQRKRGHWAVQPVQWRSQWAAGCSGGAAKEKWASLPKVAYFGP